jgi:hypothetical protein
MEIASCRAPGLWRRRLRFFLAGLALGLGAAASNCRVAAPPPVIDAPEERLALAECLRAREIMFATVPWCHACSWYEQAFGYLAFERLLRLDCDPEIFGPITPRCLELQIRTFPAFVKPDGSRLSGTRPLEELAAWSGCDEAPTKD